MAAELRERRADSRVILRIGVYVKPEPEAAVDERGRHAIAGPRSGSPRRLAEYVRVGCNGFVLNLDHERPGLRSGTRLFAAEVAPLPRS